MSKNYPEKQENSEFVAEPVASYNVRRKSHAFVKSVSSKESILSNTVSIDDYSDELIRQVKSDSSLFEDNDAPLPIDKDVYTPEELRSLLVNDLNHVYGVKEEV